MSFHSTHLSRNPSLPSHPNPLFNSKSSIQLYHQVFRQRKYLLHNQNKLKNRLNLVQKIQNKIFRETSIKNKQDEYKLKYKSLYTRNPMGGSQVESGVSIYRAIESRKKVQVEGEDENVVGIREMKRESEEYKKIIERNKKMEKTRKENMVCKIKQQKEQMKKSLSEFKELRANRVQQIIKGKIQNQKKRCRDVSKTINKLSENCHKKNRSYIIQSLDKKKPSNKTYLFTKIF